MPALGPIILAKGLGFWDCPSPIPGHSCGQVHEMAVGSPARTSRGRLGCSQQMLPETDSAERLAVPPLGGGARC